MLFINAKITAADIDEDSVDFCVEQFGVKGIYSQVEIDLVDFNDTFDLVWAGSLFTHLPLDKVKRTISHVGNYLTPRGIFIFTIIGRTAMEKTLSFGGGVEAEMQNAKKQYNETGYGFYKYSPAILLPPINRPEVSRAFSNALSIPDYGISYLSASRLVYELECMEGIQILSYHGGNWDNSHDVVVIGRK